MRKERFEPGTTRGKESNIRCNVLKNVMQTHWSSPFFFFADNNELLFGTSVSAEVHPPLAYFSKYVQLEACWNLSIQYEFFAFLLKKCFIMLTISFQGPICWTIVYWNIHVVV